MESLKTLAVRALVTAVETAFGVVVAAGLTDLTVERAEAAVAAGVAAGASVLYNAARAWLEKRTS